MFISSNDVASRRCSAYTPITTSSSFATRDFLSRNQVPYQWVDLEQNAEMRTLIVPDGAELPRLPVVLLTDGTMLVAPSVPLSTRRRINVPG